MRIMNIAMMRNNSMLEFLPPIRGSGMCRCDTSGVRAGRGLAMGACGRHVFLFSFSLGHLSLTHEQSIQAK